MPGAFGADAGGSEEGIGESVARALAEYVRWGITGIVEPGVSPGICRAYQGLRSRGELPVRVCLMPNWHGFPLEQDEERMDRLLDDMGFHTGFGDEWLGLGGLKMAIDGGLTSKTALLSWPYRGEDRPREVELRLDPDRLKGWVWAAHRAGWSVGIHVVGDISQDMAVEAIWEAQRHDPRSHRHQVIHGYYPTERALKMMSGARIIAAVQPSFIYGEADGYPDLLDKEKQESFLPLKSYLEAGVTVALSSDMPSAHFNPFWGLYSAVTRRGMNGHQLGSGEAVSAAEGLRMMTHNNAYLTGEEDLKGSLEPGKLADLVILDRDILRVRPEEIRDTAVCATMVGGWMAFDEGMRP